jgi:CsoR family transcriptional regulator, copper-sensing transcriptional repressor
VSSNTLGGYSNGSVAHTPSGYATIITMAAADTTSTAPTRGYSATKDQLLKRLRRVEGQVRGVQGMVDDERYCIDVLTQISAIQAALDKVALGLLDEHARHCVMGAEGEDQVDKTDELMAAVGRLMRRA